MPSGIVVACQNERSQHKNKAMAMKILRARLYELEMQKQRERMDALHKTKKDIAFGSQIRSYVLHPYRLVKDHRTGKEIGNADAVLDGEIDPVHRGVPPADRRHRGNLKNLQRGDAPSERGGSDSKRSFASSASPR